MNRQIRRLGVAMLVLFAALFVQLNVIQVLRADEYADKPAIVLTDPAIRAQSFLSRRTSRYARCDLRAP